MAKPFFFFFFYSIDLGKVNFHEDELSGADKGTVLHTLWLRSHYSRWAPAVSAQGTSQHEEQDKRTGD